MNKKSPVYVLSFMAAICLVFGTGIAFVHQASQGLLARNAALHRNRVLCRAFQLEVPADTAAAYQEAVNTHLTEILLDGRSFYLCRAPGRESIGLIASGMGFWDRIEAVVVLSPDLQTLLNIQFLEQKETPGLGARIEEPGFTEQFQGRLLAWDQPPGQRLLIAANPAPNAPNEVDAITGATQTSLALMRFLNEELEAARRRLAAAPPLNFSAPRSE